MLLRRRRLLIAAGLLTVASASLNVWRAGAGSPTPPPSPQQAGGAGDVSAARPRVRRAQAWPRLQKTLEVLGDRLEAHGKERLVLSGELRRGGLLPPVPFRVVRELPDRVRCELREQGRTRVLAFDGLGSSANDSPLGRDEEGLMESLAYDTVEHLLTARHGGASVSFLGPRFRLDDGEADGHNGPFYDLYQVNTRVRTGGEVRHQPKVFYVNSDTFTLDRVRYTAAVDGGQVSVEILLEEWRRVQGQLIPTRIVRLENGEPRMTLVVTGVRVGPAAADGSFGPIAR